MGYRFSDLGLKTIPPVDKSFKLLKYIRNEPPPHKPMVVSLGCHVYGAVNFWPDISDPDSLLMGTMKRVATLMPSIDLVLLEEFKIFFIEFMHTELTDCIIPFDEDLSLETWLEQTDYTEQRKEQLRVASYVTDKCIEKDYFVKEHAKHEPYTEPKHLRGIYSRLDKFKTKVGPACYYIGKKFFKLKWFIKTISMKNRAQFIYERYSASWINLCSNDFTSFEATFVVLLMQIELLFYEFCLQYHCDNLELMNDMRRAKTGVNRIFSKWFKFLLRAKRYSGEMDTSLMNSLMNLALVLFMLHKSGHDDLFLKEFPPTIEGDDSIFAHIHPIDETILVKLGAKAKIHHHATLNDASFCKILFADDTMALVTNPIDAMLNFGYTNLYYINASNLTFKMLLRAKSMSMLYTYPGCPILKNLALYGLRVTSEPVVEKHMTRVFKNMDSYKRTIIVDSFNNRHRLVFDQTITMTTRLLIEQMYSITYEMQINIEKYLDSLVHITPLYIPHIFDLVDSSRIEHFYRFGVTAKYSSFR